jgi:acyl-CoA synthetase (AMP-forming)/AMP-acid ligase II
MYNAMSEESNKNFSSLRELVERRAAEKPGETYLFSEADGRSWTFAEFDCAINRTANLLKSNGIGKGDVVSLLMPNSAEYIIAYFACWKIGALAGPVNSLLKAEEIAYVVNNSEAKLMLAGNADFSLPSEDLLPSIREIIYFDDVDAVTRDQSDDLEPAQLTLGDDAIIIYTSGTTGKPKGCLLTHGNVIANARQITDWMSYTEADRLLTIMPLFHMNAVSVTTVTPLYAGGSTVVSPKFSASKFWQIISDYKITSFGSVATMLSMLLQKYPGGVPEGMQTEQLRFAMCGSAPVPAEVMKKFEEAFHCPVIEGYGLSESTCRSTA